MVKELVKEHKNALLAVLAVVVGFNLLMGSVFFWMWLAYAVK